MQAISNLGCSYAIVGNYNTISHPHEKKGGAIVHTSQLSELNDVMSSCCLMDLGACGPKYTWNNKQICGRNIQEIGSW